MEAGYPAEPPETVHGRRPGIVNAVREFYDATIELVNLLENDSIKRDDKINKMEQLLTQRERLLQDIKPPFSPQEKQLGRILVGLNAKLERLLEKEKTAIQHDIKLVKKQKESNKKYVNPYESLASLEGGFVDKRK